MASASGKASVTFPYTSSKATLSWTFPGVTTVSSTKPFLPQAVCASYANCRLWSPLYEQAAVRISYAFGNHARLVLLSSCQLLPRCIIFAFLGAVGGSSLSSKRFFPWASRSALTSSINSFAWCFETAGIVALTCFFVLALALMWVPSMKTALGDRYPASATSSSIHAKTWSTVYVVNR